MKKLPEIFLESIKDAAGFERNAFEKIHAEETQVTSVRINPGKTTVHSQPPTINCQLSTVTNLIRTMDHPVPWSQYGYYLSQRPSFTFDPLFHAGTYYVQEASSMFLEQAFLQLTDLSKPLKVLDLCAAPGGNPPIYNHSYQQIVYWSAMRSLKIAVTF